MSRYTGPVCRLCRAEGTKLFLKGDRCYTEKCAIARRNNKPGQHGARRGKESEYGLRLREKQKLRRFYCMNESQFRRFYTMATKMPGRQVTISSSCWSAGWITLSTEWVLVSADARLDR